MCGCFGVSVLARARAMCVCVCVRMRARARAYFSSFVLLILIISCDFVISYLCHLPDNEICVTSLFLFISVTVLQNSVPINIMHSSPKKLS